MKEDFYNIMGRLFFRHIIGFLFVAIFLNPLDAQQGHIKVSGRILDSLGNPISGATIHLIESEIYSQSDPNGIFQFIIPKDGKAHAIIITRIGYENKKYIIQNGENTIVMRSAITKLDDIEVFSTGYQKIPKERSTGSFILIDSNILNKRTTMGLLDRLDGQVSSVLFDRRNNNSLGNMSNMSIRGRSTIKGNSAPLVVLDNFPYDGDINNINPNSIENITILRDAAAASIWGVQAANGVIVITTKKGKNQKARANGTINFTVAQKPNLTRIPMLGSSDQLELEELLFARGAYTDIENSVVHDPLSPFVELLIKRRNSIISEPDFQLEKEYLKGNNIVSDLQRFWYTSASSQQYSMNIAGGAQTHTYLLDAGYDRAVSSLQAVDNRFNIRTDNTIEMSGKLKLNVGVTFTNTEQNSGKPGWDGIAKGTIPISSYYTLFDKNNNPAIWPSNFRESFVVENESKGTLDWKYRPIEDVGFRDNVNREREIVLRTGLELKLLKGLNINLNYQFLSSQRGLHNIQSVSSYETRNYINQFTEITSSGDIRRRVPLGDILDNTESRLASHNFRTMMNYNYQMGDHEFSGIAGIDVRQMTGKWERARTYGYNAAVLTSSLVNYSEEYPLLYFPALTSKIYDGTGFGHRTDRNISYYMNGAYGFKNRYTASVSIRKDGSNLFGVNSNQRFVPLWSAGLSYLLTREPFFEVGWIQKLKIRATYGFNGNVDNSMSAYTTMRYSTYPDSYNGKQFATIINPPNPDLRWEKTAVTNVGLDFSILSSRLSGSVDLYSKRSTDLIGDALVDPTTGVTISTTKFGYRGNVASMKGKGLDLSVNSSNIQGKIKWNTQLNFSMANDKVTSYEVEKKGGSDIVGSGLLISPIIGKPVYGIFSYRWGGLDPAYGNPLGYSGGELTDNYGDLTTGSKYEDLVFNGSAVPTKFGNMRNTVSMGCFELSFNLVFRLGYFYRSPTVNYNMLLNGVVHPNYLERWQAPGDELTTNVPSMFFPTVSGRENFYRNSEILVHRADNIRLSDAIVSYIPKWNGRFVNNLRLYLQADNIGTIWRAHKEDYDPDILSEISIARSFSVGIRFSLK